MMARRYPGLLSWLGGKTTSRFAVSSCRFSSMRPSLPISGKRRRLAALRSTASSNSCSWTAHNSRAFAQTNGHSRISSQRPIRVHRLSGFQILAAMQRLSCHACKDRYPLTHRFPHSRAWRPPLSNINYGHWLGRPWSSNSVNDLSGSAHPALASTGFTSGSIQNPSTTLTNRTEIDDSEDSLGKLHKVTVMIFINATCGGLPRTANSFVKRRGTIRFHTISSNAVM